MKLNFFNIKKTSLIYMHKIASQSFSTFFQFLKKYILQQRIPKDPSSKFMNCESGSTNYISNALFSPQITS